ncbi:NINE protein [Undibacterium sp. Ji22W]|uniref:TM2 domain-containing protein n=1 Tax=Undibacterium sp. Ji22W TaxID=3413038 RepID=UPI003BF22ECC
MEEKFCRDCGAGIHSLAEICPKCGVRQMPVPSAVGPLAANGKSRVVAALLSFFLGWFGAHKFYLNRGGWGVVYLIFFWTGIPAVVSFFECILLLVMSDTEFNYKYGQL